MTSQGYAILSYNKVSKVQRKISPSKITEVTIVNDKVDRKVIH